MVTRRRLGCAAWQERRSQVPAAAAAASVKRPPLRRPIRPLYGPGEKNGPGANPGAVVRTDRARLELEPHPQTKDAGVDHFQDVVIGARIDLGRPLQDG